jgi:hypothetical protein
MEQDSFVSSSSADTIEEVEPTALQRLQHFIAMQNAPRQVHSVTSSETEFLDSLSRAEGAFIYELGAAWESFTRRDISRWTMRNRLIEAGMDASVAGVDPHRQHQIIVRARCYASEAFRCQKLTAQRTFRQELSALVKKFKRRKPLHRYYQMGTFTKYIKDFKEACHSSFRRGLGGMMELRQARNITYHVARKLKFHSGVQLWRYVKVDVVVEMLNQIHFDQ